MIFIHIPKTAGTSFRLGASAFFGPENEIRDYGKKVQATSPLVRKFIYKKRDYETFRKIIYNRRIKFITGHFPSEKYLSYFDSGTFVTFVRDPVQRVVSEYKHAVRVNGYKGTLREFCQRRRHQNRQYGFIKSIGIDNMAFIGITEHYEESLAVINSIFHTKIPFLTKNIGKSSIEEPHFVAKDDHELIRSLNDADFDVYETAKERFDRWMGNSIPHEDNRYEGKIQWIRDGKIVGWAVNQTHEVPVEISVFVNDVLLGHTMANQYRPGLKKAGIKRSGCAGIQFNIEERSVKAGDIVEFRVKSTNQVVGRMYVE